MKQPNPILSIKKPCHENWEQMSPTQQGRFCQACSKTVVDFTEMGDEAIIKLLGQSSGRVCGRFFTDQVNRELKPTPVVKPAPFFYRAVASLMLLTGVSSAEAETTGPEQKTVLTDTGEENIKQMQGEVMITLPDIDIKGSVVNTYGQGLKCTLQLAGTDLQVESDAKGKFTIKVPPELRRDVMTFVVQAHGYKQIKFTVQSAELPLRKDMILTMYEERMMIKGDVIF